MKIEFISYDGEYPNLCHGMLIVKIDGKEVRFGGYPGKKTVFAENKLYQKFWSSGGCIKFTRDYSDCNVKHAEWELDANEDNYPDEIRHHLNELIDVFNENVPYGCCGGCI